MEMMKKTITVILVITSVLYVSSCSRKNKFEHLIEAAKDNGCSRTRNLEYANKAFNHWRGIEAGFYYIGDNPEDAQELYDVVINDLDLYPDYEIVSAAVLYICEEDDGTGELFNQKVIYLRFGSKEDAAEYYADKTDGSFLKKTENRTGSAGYKYLICAKRYDAKRNESDFVIRRGYYLDGNEVIVMEGRETSEGSPKLIDECCRKTGLISPAKIKV